MALSSLSFDAARLGKNENDDFSTERIFEKCLHDLCVQNPFRGGICSPSTWARGELPTMAIATELHGLPTIALCSGKKPELVL